MNDARAYKDRPLPMNRWFRLRLRAGETAGLTVNGRLVIGWSPSGLDTTATSSDAAVVTETTDTES